MRLLVRALAVAAACATSGAQAVPGYDYLEGSVIGIGYQQPIAPTDDSATGLRFGLSMAFDDAWFWTLQVGGAKFQTEYGNQWKVGLGYAFPMDWFDVSVELDYGRNDLGVASGGGFAWDVKLRSATWDDLELSAHLGQTQAEPIDDFLHYGVGAAWRLTDSFALTLELDQSTGDVVDLNGYAIGLRWTY
jgi:hypothetical protein